MRLVVRIAVPGRRTIESRMFTTSPVTVGSSDTNALQLPAASVLPEEGMFLFEGDEVAYVGHEEGAVIRVDGILAQPCIPIRLRPLSVIDVGECRLSVEPIQDEPQSAGGFGGTGIVRAISRMPIRHERSALLDLVNLGVKLADAVATTIIELRERQPQGVRPFDNSLLQRSWNYCEIADYLLDPSASDNRFRELRRCLLELARGQALPFSGRGQA